MALGTVWWPWGQGAMHRKVLGVSGAGFWDFEILGAGGPMEEVLGLLVMGAGVVGVPRGFWGS